MDDLAAFYDRKAEWSRATFGGGSRWRGLIEHIRAELDEIASEPSDLTEWVDVVLLAMDGAARAGHDGEAFVRALLAKHEINTRRTWPRNEDQDRPTLHLDANTNRA